MKTNDASHPPFQLQTCRLAFGRHCIPTFQYDGDITREGEISSNAELYRCLQLSLNLKNTAAFMRCLLSDCSIGTSVTSRQSDLNRPVFRFNTALHLAAYRCNAAVVSELLQTGADTTVRNDRDYTPYDLAKIQESIQFDANKRADCQETITLFQRAINSQNLGSGIVKLNNPEVDSEFDPNKSVCLYASER